MTVQVYKTTSMRKATYLIYCGFRLMKCPITPNGDTQFIFDDDSDNASERIAEIADPSVLVSLPKYCSAEDEVRGHVSANREVLASKKSS